ncbi:MAG TPA: AzlC family ABC transporter permease [Burkholderiales bacterium]
MSITGTGATPRREFIAGLAAVTPMLFGAVPFGLIYGALAVKAGIPPLPAILISSIVFAGSAQFLITKLVAAATPGALMVLAVGVINLRHALYSAALAEKLAHLPLRWKALLAYLLTDEAYATALRRMDDERDPDTRHWYLLGAGFGLWFTWQIACIIGVLLGGRIPAAWSLDFAGTLTFIAIVVPLLRDRASLGAMLTAGVISIVAFALPHKLFIIVAAFAGMGAGVLLERIANRRKEAA